MVSTRDVIFGLTFCVVIGFAPAGQSQPTENGLVPGLQPYSAAAPARSPSSSAKGSGQSANASQASSVSTNYVLGPGDKLRIIVFGEDNLSGEFTVAGNGALSLPLIGDIPAAGRSVDDVRQQMAAALKDGYLKDPRVSAEVLTFRPYYILGEVSKPGEYPYSNGISAMNAIATAGGFTYRANHSYIYLKHASETGEKKVRLTGQVLLAPGDTIRVVERYF